MGKDKLKRFADIRVFRNVIETEVDEVLNKDYNMKGQWGLKFFGDQKPLILELGCGKGEYTVSLAEKYPEINFLGIDIKGARLWKGAKTALENNIPNAGFIRTRIEFINSFFGPNEVSEIWITFPDPQLKEKRIKKRLTCPGFLSNYQKFLVPDGIIHLKTDSRELYDYTMEVLRKIDARVHFSSTDIYSIVDRDPVLDIKTFYEKQFLMKDKAINYVRFSLPENPFV